MPKKKIKDLTIAEIRRICEWHFCHDCPLFKRDDELKEDGICLLDVPEFIPDCMLDVEIEIPNEPVGNSDQLEEENEQKI